MGKGHEVINCPEYNSAFPRLGEDENDIEKENELTFDPPADDAWQREQAMITDAYRQTPEERMEIQRQENTSEPHETGNSTPSTSEVNKNTLSDNSKVPVPKEPSTTNTATDPTTNTTAPKIDNPGGVAFPPPLTDTTDPSSEDKEEPPLKTSKTTKPTTKVDNGVGEPEQEQEREAGKTTTAKAQGKKAKKKKGRNPAVNVSGGKNRSPFLQ